MIVTIGRKVRFHFHHTLPFMTKQRCSSAAATSTLNQKFRIKRLHGPLMVRILGGPLRLNERAANDIFSGWTSPNRPLMLKKPSKMF